MVGVKPGHTVPVGVFVGVCDAVILGVGVLDGVLLGVGGNGISINIFYSKIGDTHSMSGKSLTHI
jgi:hypothetical protein